MTTTTVNTGTNNTLEERTSSFTALYSCMNGRITGRRESKATNGSEPTIFLDVVYDVPVKQEDNSYKLESHWVDVIVPKGLSSRIGKYLIKGKFITVFGPMRLGHYMGEVKFNNVQCCHCSGTMDVAGKVKKLKVEMIATDIRLLPGSKAGQSTDGQAVGVATSAPAGQQMPQGQSVQGQVFQPPVPDDNQQYITPPPAPAQPQMAAPGAPVNPNEIPF